MMRKIGMVLAASILSVGTFSAASAASVGSSSAAIIKVATSVPSDPSSQSKNNKKKRRRAAPSAHRRAPTIHRITTVHRTAPKVRRSTTIVRRRRHGTTVQRTTTTVIRRRPNTRHTITTTVRRRTTTTVRRHHARPIHAARPHHGPRIARRINGPFRVHGRRVVIIRGPHHVYWHGRRRALLPLAALGGLTFGSLFYTPYAFIPVEERYCEGYTDDGCFLQWTAVPTLEGDYIPQCVAYCPRLGVVRYPGD